MSTPHEQLADRFEWQDLLAALSADPSGDDDAYVIWSRVVTLVQEIESSESPAPWVHSLDQVDYDPQVYSSPARAYARFVLMSALRQMLADVHPLMREGDQRWLDGPTPSALLWLCGTLTIDDSLSAAHELRFWTAYEDDPDDEDDDDEWEDEDGDDDEWEDEDEEDDEDDEDEQDERDEELLAGYEDLRHRVRMLASASASLSLVELSVVLPPDVEAPLPALILPTVETLSLTTVQGSGRACADFLARLDGWQRLVSLHLTMSLSSPLEIDAITLTRGMEQLEISLVDTSPAVAAALLRAGLGASARTLAVALRDYATTSSFTPLVQALRDAWPEPLIDLSLSSSPARPLDLDALRQAPGFERLERLTLSYLQVSDEPLTRLVADERLSRLESLTLTAMELRDEHIEALVHNPAMSALRSLIVDDNLISARGAHALAMGLPGLEVTSMYDCLVEVHAIDDLRERFGAQYARPAEERFGELRSLLQEPPSEDLWRRLGEQLDTMPDSPALREVILPYVQDYTGKWPASLCVPSDTWLRRLMLDDELPTRALIRAVRLEDVVGQSSIDDEEEAVRASMRAIEQLTSLESLSLCYINMLHVGLEQLLEGSILGRLRTLEFEDNYDLEAAQLAAFLKRAPLERLVELSFSGEAVDKGVLQALCKRDWATRLESLSVLNSSQTPPTLTWLLKQPLRALRRLRLHGWEELSEERPSAWRCEWAGPLEVLELYESPLPPGALAALAKLGLLSGLTRLDLSMAALDPSGMEPLYRVSPPLRQLIASYNDLDPEAFVKLLQSPLGQTLEVLDWSYNQGVSFVGLEDAPLVLRELSLAGSLQDASPLAQLGRCRWLSQVRSLSLVGNALSADEALREFAQSPYLAGLQTLTLYGMTWDDEAREVLLRSPWLSDSIKASIESLDEDDYYDEIME